MGKLCVLCALVSIVVVLAVEHTEGAAAGREARRMKRQGYYPDSDVSDYPASDVDLLQHVFKTPMKRQWCRAGMSYNPVLGTCTLSLAAMRGRRINFRA